MAETRNTCPARDSEPDLVGQLSPDVVETESREQANDGGRHGSRSEDHVVVLCGVRWSRKAVSAWSNSFQYAGPSHAIQRFGVHAFRGGVPRSEKGISTEQLQ